MVVPQSLGSGRGHPSVNCGRFIRWVAPAVVGTDRDRVPSTIRIGTGQASEGTQSSVPIPVGAAQCRHATPSLLGTRPVSSLFSVPIDVDRAASEPDPPAPETDPSSFGRAILGTEVVLGLLAWTLGRWSGIDWTTMIHPTVEGVRLGVLGGLGLVTLHLILVLPGGPRNPLYRRIYEPLRRVLRPWARSTSVVAIVGVALASGIAEELFFRGWLQTQTNVVVASLLFGAAHLWGRGALPYGAYATLMGFGLGGLFAYTGSHLWAPILAHVLNNLLGLLTLRYGWTPTWD